MQLCFVFVCAMLVVVLPTCARAQSQPYLIDANHKVMRKLFKRADKDELATVPLCYYEPAPNKTAAETATKLSNMTWKAYSELMEKSKRSPLKVQIQLQLLQVTDVSEKDQTVSLVVEMTLMWMDCRLRWSSDESDIPYITLLPKKFKDFDVFVPVVRLLEATDPQADAGSETLVTIVSNGEVMLSREFSPTVSCNINVEMYPFDSQQCTITVESSIDETFMSIGYAEAANIEDESLFLLGNGRYLASDTWGVALFPPSKVRRLVCASGNESYCFRSGLNFTLVMRRHPVYQLINLIFPSFLVVIIASCVFIMPPFSTDKMGLSLTILLSMFMFTQLMYDKMPDTGSYVPVLSEYFMICIGLVGASCISSALSASLEAVCRPVPRCFRRVVQFLAPVLMFDLIEKANVEVHKKETGADSERDDQGAKQADEDCSRGFRVDDLEKIQWRVVSALTDRIFFVLHLTTCVASLTAFLVYGFDHWYDFGYGYNDHEWGLICHQLQLQGDAYADAVCRS